MLKEVDKIEIFVLMDNLSDPFTVSHPGMRLNECQYQFEERSCTHESGKNFCRACLGLSLFIRIHANQKSFNILFDTGPDDGLAVENAKRLGINLQEVDAVVLSHGHFDHISGLPTCLKAIGKRVPVYCHEDVFAPKASRTKDGRMITCSSLSKENIEKIGGDIVQSNDVRLFFDNHVLLTGEISRSTDYELGVPGELRWKNEQWIDWSLMRDEQALILKLKGKGLCVFTGCGHPGVINTLKYAKSLTGEEMIHVIMGGYHLAGPSFEKRISQTVNDLKELDPDYMITGHCTGFKAQVSLTEKFGDRHIPYGVGTVFRF